ncbi:hypothetical protein SAMN04489727_8667 [Amycolatopsis tolypomycina]|uniref:Uncharacterized protein n=1 Tax=Amycolatopsis tolypomycina TaxID=208445 RepID=A0A1H5C934_9PSEU|nr:hypothetical protein [Amycolatopsis tolypomycina]SED63329.1 hypothetical protein SAMN04489727_8667 [Amycolatopsis tolypomycina]
MLARTAWATAALLVGVFAPLGVLGTSPGGLAGLGMLGLTIGALVTAVSPPVRHGMPARTRTAALRAGALAAAIFFALFFTVSGMLATLSGALTAALVVVFAALALVADLRRSDHRSRPRTNDVVAAVISPPPARPVTELSLDELCTSWRRSYFQLLVSRDASARRHLVQRRQDYLDEIERRDRSGFLRWLGSGARPGGDPGPYLTPRS